MKTHIVTDAHVATLCGRELRLGGMAYQYVPDVIRWDRPHPSTCGNCKRVLEARQWRER